MRMLKIAVDESGDVVAVGQVIDQVFSTDEDGASMLKPAGTSFLPGKSVHESQGKLLSKMSGEEQTA